METSEAVDEDESCRSSVISDLDELEANFYSYVHHERNSGFDEEYSTVVNVSSVERFSYQNVSLGENEEENRCSFESGSLNSSGLKEDGLGGSEDKQLAEFGDSACFVSRSECDVNSPVQPSGNASLQSSGKEPKATSGQSKQNRGSSPPILDISSSDDLDPAERNLSKRKLLAASTPVKEFVVLDDSDEEVQIEFEKIALQSKKKKKRKKEEIKEDIRLNTRRNTDLICLDIDDDLAFSGKENVDSLHFDQGYGNSEHESSLCKSWTPQMVQFYDEPWGGECINVSELQRTMSDDGWKVDLSDQFSALTKKFDNRRYFGVKSNVWCNRCNQKGHYRNNCKEKINPPRCYRCGSTKHQEYSCNQKLCLTCGRVRSSLIPVCQQCRNHSRRKCYICQQPGHPPGCCPDLWRRFHATVAPGEIIAPAKVLYKDPKNTYCCNCASRGHHVFQCKKDNFSSYVPINPMVTSYVDPEVLLSSQNMCSHTPSNWDSIGAVAPEYYNEDQGKRSYPGRGIKRPKTSGKQPKAKHRKLNEIASSELACTEVSSPKSGRFSDQSLIKNKVKSVKLKFKKKIVSEKNICKKDKFARTVRMVDNGNPQIPKSSLDKDKKHKDNSTTKGLETKPETKGKKVNDCDPNTGSVERIVVLSPGHLKRIETDEGKEILKYVTDQFQGVTAKVVNNPSGILRLMGTGNDIDQVKSTLFDVLNNKRGLDQLKKASSTIGHNLRVTIQNTSTPVAVVRSKQLKKKFQNPKKRNNNQEKWLKNRGKNSASVSEDSRVKVSDQRQSIKKKKTAFPKVKCTVNNDNVNKLNHQEMQSHWQSVVYNNPGDHTGNNHNTMTNYSPDVRQVGFGVSSKFSEQRENLSEVRHNSNQGNEGVAKPRIAKPRSNQQNAKFRVNKGKFKKRKNKAQNQLSASKQGEVINGQELSTKMPIKFSKRRKVSNINKDCNDHSRISENQFSKYNLNMNCLRAPNSSSTSHSPQVS